MKMVIGGAYQGKLAWAKEYFQKTEGIKENDWIDGKLCAFHEIEHCKGIYDFHIFLRRLLEEEQEEKSRLPAKNKEIPKNSSVFTKDVTNTDNLEIQDKNSTFINNRIKTDNHRLLRTDNISDIVWDKNPNIVLVSNEIGYGLVPVDAFEREYREYVGRVCTELAGKSNLVVRIVMGNAMAIKGKINTTERDICMDNIRLEQVLPQEIEKRSFEIITEELGKRTFPEGIDLVVKRCIHTSADFDYADNLIFSDNVVERAIGAIKCGATIVTDTQMARSGINKKKLAQYGGEVICFMSDEDVAKEAKERGVTRATVSMERAAKLEGPVIFAIGNAPTALIKLYELIREGKVNPELVIGVPVGFVNVVQSKELILSLKDTPYIVARGRKGGSNIAACICNALLYQM